MADKSVTKSKVQILELGKNKVTKKILQNKTLHHFETFSCSVKQKIPKVIFFLVHLARHFAIMRTRPNSFVSI